MKTSTINALVSFIDGNPVDNLAEIRAELVAETHRNDEAKAAKASEYAAAHDVVMAAMSTTPATAAEIFEACKDDLPDGFTKGKVTYALRALWGDEVVKTEGKVNLYALKA